MSVAILSSQGDGFPDIIVGYEGRNYLFEIKNPDKKPSARRLTEDEDRFHKAWLGQVDTIHTVEEIISVLGVRYEG